MAGACRLCASRTGEALERLQMQPDGGERVADVMRHLGRAGLGGGGPFGGSGGGHECEVRHGRFSCRLGVDAG